MSTRILQLHLRPLAERQLRQRLHQVTIGVLALTAAEGVALLLLPASALMTWLWLAGAIVTLLVVRALVRRRHTVDFDRLAGDIERQHPELRVALVTAVEQRASGQGLSYLQQRLISEVVAHAERHAWLATVPARRLSVLAGVSLMLLAFTGTLAVALLAGVGARPAPAPALEASAQAVEVVPGDLQVGRGKPVVVLARFPGVVPDHAVLVIGPAGGAASRVDLVRNLNDPVFGTTVAAVGERLSYHVEFPGGRSPTYTLDVFDLPALERADAEITYPAYTGLGVKQLPDTRAVSLVEGSQLAVAFLLTKEVASAQLVDAQGQAIALAVDPQQPTTWHLVAEPTVSAKYRLALTDAEGRSNQDQPRFAITVQQNRAPALKATFPGKDATISPLQELALEAQVSDDFALRGVGLTYTLGANEPVEVPLAAPTDGGKATIAHQLAVERLGAQPHEMLSYFFWAEDVGADGQVRRTRSDLYFAEVRPLSETFRERVMQGGGQPPPPSLELIKLQRQIVIATYKLVDRAERPAREPALVADLAAVAGSQAAVQAKLTELKEEIDEPRQLALAESAIRHMGVAQERLAAAGAAPGVAPVSAAQAAERAALQDLVRLAASAEHQVTRSEGGGEGGAESREQRDVSELELTQADRRYESESSAQQQRRDAAQAEELQVLSRLRELATRQGDLNQQAKEVAAALRAAPTPEQRAELQASLKRLQEQQQEILRDIDELRERMERPEHRERLAQQRQRLDQAREQTQRANEALKQQDLDQAVSGGTRVQDQLEQLRDEVHERSAGAFAEDLQRLRAQAQQVDERQQAIVRQLADQPAGKPQSLTGEAESPPIVQALAGQQEALQQLFEDLRRTTEAAEESQPVLSRKLYDAMRQAKVQGVEQELERVGELARRNSGEQAQAAGQRAGDAVRELRERIDQAADSTTGDQAATLRRTREQIDALIEAIRQEQGDGQQPGDQPQVASAEPGQQGQGRQEQGQQEQGQQGQGQQGQGQQGQGQQEQGQQGQGQQGQGQQGQGRQGQGQQGQGQQEQGQQGEGQQGQGQQGQGQQEQGQPGQGQGQQGQGQQGQGQQGQGQQGQGQQGQGQGQQGQGRRGQGQGQGQGQQGQGQLGRSQGQQGPGRGRSASPTGTSFGRGEGPGSGMEGPLSGGDFQQFSDQLRDVEESLSDPALRNRAAQVRDRARSIRGDFKRHGAKPQYTQVQQQLVQPLLELRAQVAQELARQQGDALVPIDRDPVPAWFTDMVGRYYQKLGSGR